MQHIFASTFHSVTLPDGYSVNYQINKLTAYLNLKLQYMLIQAFLLSFCCKYLHFETIAIKHSVTEFRNPVTENNYFRA